MRTAAVPASGFESGTTKRARPADCSRAGKRCAPPVARECGPEPCVSLNDLYLVEMFDRAEGRPARSRSIVTGDNETAIPPRTTKLRAALKHNSA
jgi:hypothetical protein